MMKRAPAYAVTAILLGTLMMLAPLMLVKPSSPNFMSSGGEKNLLPCERAGEETLGGKEALERVVSPFNLSSAGLMLIPSFLIALGAFLYLKKRMF